MVGCEVLSGGGG